MLTEDEINFLNIVDRTTTGSTFSVFDAAWDEAKHPRADDGRFGEGSGGAAKGGYKITIDDDDDEGGKETVDSFVKTVLGPDANHDSLAELCGAQPGDSVTYQASRHNPNKVAVFVKGDGYSIQQWLWPTKFHTARFTCTATGSGTGTKVILHQMRAAAKAGYKQMELIAARSEGLYNGYYTWARLGYDGAVPSTCVDNPFGAKRVSEFMTTPERRNWWKENGDTFSGTFDLTEGSVSRQVLEAYAKAKGLT